jgi:transposase
VGRQRHGPGDEVGLEEGRFTWPPIRDGVVSLTATQLSMLVDGLDWTRVTPKSVKRPVGMM